MISANARLYEYVMPFGIVCSPPVYQFTNLPIYSRTQVGHASTYRRQHICADTGHDTRRHTHEYKTRGRAATAQRRPKAADSARHVASTTSRRLLPEAHAQRALPASRPATLRLLPFLLPTFVDVALAAALGGEPPHLTLPLTLPIDLPALPPIGGRW